VERDYAIVVHHCLDEPQRRLKLSTARPPLHRLSIMLLASRINDDIVVSEPQNPRPLLANTVSRFQIPHYREDREKARDKAAYYVDDE
jgi:hypothetical protein